MIGPAEADIDFDIIKNDNDTFTVKYTPPGAGRYTIMVLFADQVRIGFLLEEGLMVCVRQKDGFLLLLLLLLFCFILLQLPLSGNSHQPIQSQSGSFP